MRFTIQYCFLPGHHFPLLSGFLFSIYFLITWLFFLPSSQYYLRIYITCFDSGFPTLVLFWSAEHSTGFRVARPSIYSSALPYGILINSNELGFGVIWFIFLAYNFENFHSPWKIFITLTEYHEHIYIFVNILIYELIYEYQ